MSSEWAFSELGKEATNASRSFSFADYPDVVFVNTGDVHRGNFLHSNISVGADLPGQAKKALRRNDILLSEIRPGNGRFAFVDFDVRKYVVSTKFMVIESLGRVSPRFLFHILTNQGALDEFQRIAESRSGTFPQITFDSIAHYPVPVPPAKDQDRLTEFLDALENRITLLREANATLEAIAHALFKSWFVDFDPVRAKMEGRVPEGIDEATAALFPDSFEESELGSIPLGWKTAVLAELTSKIGSGATPRGGKDVYLDDGVALIRSQNVYDSEFVWGGLARISNDAADQLKGVEVKPTDVLLNITGASILRTCAVIPDVLPARVNQHVAIIRVKESIPSRYIHLHLLQRKTKEFLLGLNAGGSREAVTKAHIESVPIIRPSDAVLAAFREITNPIYLRGEVFSRQERTLATLRDTLLPRLISGQLRLPEAQSQLEEAYS